MMKINNSKDSPTKKKIKQFDLYYTLAWIRSLDLTIGEKSIMFALASRMNRKGTCYPGLEKIAEDSGYAHGKSVSPILQKLKDKELLTIKARNKGYDNRKTNLYSFPNQNSNESIIEENLKKEDINKWIKKLVGNFSDNKLTFNSVSKLWFLAIEQLRPNLPRFKLSKYEVKAITDIISWCSDKQYKRNGIKFINKQILYSMAYSIKDWDTIVIEYQKNNSYENIAKNPTLPSFVNNFEDIYSRSKEYYPDSYSDT